MDRHPGHVFKTGKNLNIPDTENDPEGLSISSKRSFVVRSRLYVPVLNGTQPVGALGIVSSQKKGSARNTRLFSHSSPTLQAEFMPTS